MAARSSRPAANLARRLISPTRVSFCYRTITILTGLSQSANICHPERSAAEPKHRHLHVPLPVLLHPTQPSVILSEAEGPALAPALAVARPPPSNPNICHPERSAAKPKDLHWHLHLPLPVLLHPTQNICHPERSAAEPKDLHRHLHWHLHLPLPVLLHPSQTSVILSGAEGIYI